MQTLKVGFLLMLLAPGLASANTGAEDKSSVEALKERVRQEPADLGAWYLLAKSYLGFGQPIQEVAPGVNQNLEDSGAFYDDALRRLEQGEQVAALIQLKNAIKADENNLAAYLLLAETYSDMRSPQMAEQYLRESLLHGADPNLVMVSLAEALIASEQYDVLINDLPLTGLPASRKARLRAFHARAYAGLQRFEEARAMLEAALQEDPTLVPVHLESARLSVILGELTEARQSLAEISDAGEFVPDYWLLRGEIARSEGLYREALQHYERAISLQADHRLALGAAADLHLKSGNLNAAQALVEQVRQWYPDDLRALLLELTIARASGDEARTEAVIIEANKVVSRLDYARLQQDPFALNVVGNIHYLSNHMSEAAALFSQYLEYFPADLDAVRLLVGAQLSQQQPAAALRTLGTASAHHKDSPLLWLLYADTHIADKNFKAALPYLDQVLEVMPDYRDARLKRAKVNASLGRYESAVNELQLMQDEKNDAAVSAVLADLLLALGRFDDVIAITATGILDETTATMTRGKALLGKGDLSAARAAFEEVLSTDPDATAALFHIGVIQRQLGDSSGARTTFEQVLGIDRAHRLAMLQLAAMAENQNDRIGAARYLADAMKVKPHVEDGIRLVRLLMSDNRGQDARDTLSNLKLQFPSNLKVMALDAEFNVQSDNVARARQIFVNMRDLAVESSSVAALIAIAREQYAIEDKENALRTLEAAQKLDPANLSVTIVRAEFSQLEGDHAAALKLADDIVRRAPTEPIGFRLKGDALRATGKQDEALAVYEEGLKQTPGSLELVRNRYLLQRQHLGIQAAVASLETFVRSDSSANYAVLRMLAAGYAETDQLDRAIALNESLLDDQPNDPIVLNNLALAYDKKSDPRAREFAQRAYDLAPENYAIMDTLGWILVNQGEVTLGLTILRNALARAADVPDLRYHYAVALHRNGNTQAAARELRTLLAEGGDFPDREAARSLYERLR